MWGKTIDGEVFSKQHGDTFSPCSPYSHTHKKRKKKTETTLNLLNFCRGLFCPIVGCGARLTSLEGFEDHYNARHTASCSVCSRVYPTSRLLSIHVSEAHDSFFQAKVARGYAMVFFVYPLLCELILMLSYDVCF